MNKIILFLALSWFAFYQVEGAKNVESREDQKPCPREFEADSSVKGVSDCADRDLSIGSTYNDKCCYVRAMVDGEVVEGCAGAPRNYTIDIPGAIEFYEDNYYKTHDKHVKIYAVDCNASFIQLFALATILFSLII